MTTRVAIVGAGTAGLHLGLFLRQSDVHVTIYTALRPEKLAASRLLNTVAHHHVTIEREEALGVNHWPCEDYGYFGHHYYVNGKEPLSFYGDYAAPSRAVDYRIYQPRLMNDFVAHGGSIRYGEVCTAQLSALARDYDLVVASMGKGSFQQLFARDESESQYDKPLRLLCVGLFKGIEQRETPAVTMYFSPGHGEMIEIPTLTFGGMATALVIENVPGGDLEVLAHTRYEDDPEAFRKLLLRKLKKHYPVIMARIDESHFDLVNGPLDILQGGFSPTIRASHTILDDGTVVPAVGDLHALVDPMTGQGANMASHGAWILGEEILAHDIYDHRFIEAVDRRRNDRILSSNRWTNYLLANLPAPPPELWDVLVGLSENRKLCDEFTENFNFPERHWDCFASPARMRAWVASHTPEEGSSFRVHNAVAHG